MFDESKGAIYSIQYTGICCAAREERLKATIKNKREEIIERKERTKGQKE
jgi:hypothetical protein